MNELRPWSRLADKCKACGTTEKKHHSQGLCETCYQRKMAGLKEGQSDINECEIVEKIFRKDRWYVRIAPSFNGVTTMPQAVYVWLKGNPAFIDVPKDYVVHHLDGDKLNDDISNLVIMQKHHHVAHHYKQKTIDSDVKIFFDQQIINRTAYFPTQEPRIYKRKDSDLYVLAFREMIDGRAKRISLCTYKGKKLRTQELAEWAKNEIWDQVRRRIVDPSNYE